MQQTKHFPEKSLIKENILNSVKFYSWPYSQPKIVNTIKAASHMGYLFGFLTIPLVLSNIYSEQHILFIDFVLVLSYMVLRAGIIPAIRRNQIRYTPSESRRINYYGLLLSSMILHSAIIRATVAVIAFLIKNMEIYTIKESILLLLKMSVTNLSLTTVVLTLTIAVLPIILIMYPRDIKITDYHYKLLELQKSTYEASGYKEEAREPVPLFPTNLPRFNDTYVPNTSSNTNVKANTKNNGNHKKPNVAKQKSNNHSTGQDIWETKIAKRQRRD